MGLYRATRCHSSGATMNLSLIANPSKASRIKCPTCHQQVTLFKDTMGRYVVIERHNSIAHRNGEFGRRDGGSRE